MSELSLSVVVASGLAGGGLPECLEALAPQRAAALEVIVVSPAGAGGCRQEHAWVNWVTAPTELLVPQLWSLGIAAAAGEVVALTTAHFEPSPDWVDVVRAAHVRLAAPAIGGPVDPPRAGSAVAWATYFLRYSAYLDYTEEQAVADLAADNCSYKRAAVLAHPEFLKRGFWEQELHAQLRSSGQTLVFLPGMRVRLGRSFGFAAFLRQRLLHGRHFGLARMRPRGVSWRMAAIAGAPLIPAILLAKIGLRVLRSRRDLGWFVAVLPILCAFVSAWSAGEISAYVAPGRRVRP